MSASRTELISALKVARVLMYLGKDKEPGAFARMGLVNDIDEILAREPEPQEAKIVLVQPKPEHEIVRTEERQDTRFGDSMWRAHCRCGHGTPWCVFKETLEHCFNLHLSLQDGIPRPVTEAGTVRVG